MDGIAVDISFEGHTYVMTKTGSLWHQRVSKAQLHLRKDKERHLLELSHPLLLPVRTSCQGESVLFVYGVPQGVLTFEQLLQCSRQDQLRAMVNVAHVKELLELPVSFFIHPENLLFTYNLQPLLAYRGPKGKEIPAQMTEPNLLRQYKSLIVSLFAGGTEFSLLYEGQLELQCTTPFLREVSQTTSISQLRSYLFDCYHQAEAHAQATVCEVGKARLAAMKYLFICCMLLLATLSSLWIEFSYVEVPLLEGLQQADHAFLVADYASVLICLAHLPRERIPRKQQYELAYSSVHEAEVSLEQKEAFLLALTQDCDQDYLTYWIEYGREDYDEALPSAKRLGNPALIQLGLLQKMEQVRQTEGQSEADKKRTLEALETEYRSYAEEEREPLATPLPLQIGRQP